MNDILNRGSYLNSTTTTTTTTINGRPSSSATTTTPALTTTTTAARRGGGAKGRSGSGSRKSPTSLAQALDDNRDPTNTSITATATTGSNTTSTTMGSGMHSLAHELAVALMPEPSAGSKLLHEELGIEFDEGAEGIDELPDHHHHNDFGNGDSLAAELNGHQHTANGAGAGGLVDDQTYELRTPVSDEDFAAHFGSGAGAGAGAGDVTPKRRERGKKKPVVKPYEDPMKMLSNDLESTDRFLSQLRRIDADVAHSSFISPPSSSSSSDQASLEQYASDVIRHINDSVRDREGQVRQLVEYEREFRKIAGEVNGGEVLGRLDALKDVGILSDKQKNNSSASSSAGTGTGTDRQQVGGNSLETIKEDVRTRKRRSSTDWETNHLLDEEMNVYNDDDDDDLNDNVNEEDEEEEGLDSSSLSPMKDSFIAPPPITGPPTIDQMLPHLVHVRSLSTSLSSSLTAMSEHAQVNGAANTDAGRKIRALKNKLGSWRSEWDSAEQSRLKIERWEAGLVDDINSPVTGTGTTTTGGGSGGSGSGGSSPRLLVGVDG
ncbi:hypothetical protein PNOK_0453700 [Pyrrhoderma noxium]|uniref:Uncharacterized protein n=1 Tax=Pyrrhoderma noxium TaxID=2282107 RepID=A0A286UJ00_9AGAM|nr:hypothetical protein PNOK_0453700 [Pyrrhoderma noxium]